MFNADFAHWAGAIQMVIALILSVAVHEFGHAWVANRLGDSLPRLQGRLTLNPVRHADLVGTIILPLVGFFNPGLPVLGWGKPVQTNPLAYTRKYSRVTGSMLVAIAGPSMNLLLVLISSLAYVITARSEVNASVVSLCGALIRMNFGLFFLNLLPIPPLDGGSVLAWVLPRSMQNVIDFLQRWGFVILLALVFTQKLGVVLAPGYYVAGMWQHWLNGLVGE